MSTGNYEEGWEVGFQKALSLSKDGWEEAIGLLERSLELLDESGHWFGTTQESAKADKLLADLKEFLRDGDEETYEGEAADTD